MPVSIFTPACQLDFRVTVYEPSSDFVTFKKVFLHYEHLQKKNSAEMEHFSSCLCHLRWDLSVVIIEVTQGTCPGPDPSQCLVLCWFLLFPQLERNSKPVTSTEGVCTRQGLCQAFTGKQEENIKTSVACEYNSYKRNAHTLRVHAKKFLLMGISY